MALYEIRPLSSGEAECLSKWTYEGEYAVYSFAPEKETITEFLSGAYYACLDASNDLIGFFCFGSAAQIPTTERNVYSPEKLDIGLGMKPSLCGQGLGLSFLRAGVEFARETLGAGELRLTVASFNQRAVRLYSRAGFQQTSTVTHRNSHKPFLVMCCSEFGTGIKPCAQRC